MKDDLLKVLQPHHQEHLLAFWDELIVKEQEHLASQIKSIDLDRIAEMYSARFAGTTVSQNVSRAEPPAAVRMSDAAPARESEAGGAGRSTYTFCCGRWAATSPA